MDEPPPEGVDWSLLENVRREWPRTDFDADADLRAWREGRELYDARDDYASMIRAGALMCRALRHHLYGDGLLVGGDLPNTTHAVLFASAFPPPDRQSFPDSVAAQLRLALTIVKKHGWQSPEHGGSGMMADFLGASHMVMAMAVAPTSARLWEGNLRQFFTTNPVEIAASEPPAATPVPPPPDEGVAAVVESAHRSAQEAQAGDPAAQARMRGIAEAMAGHPEAALREFEQAAQMGDIDAMYDAGTTAHELGLVPQAVYWFEAAADGGHATAAYNLGVLSYNAGDHAAARGWWERCGAAGDASGYAALTQLADELGDDEAELRCSRLGAEQGQAFCQMRYAQLLMRRDPRDAAVFRGEVIPLLSRAAEAGENGAAFLLGVAYGQLGDAGNARLWLKRAQANGDADATRVLREQGWE